MPYYHAVFTLPAPILQNKAAVYDLLFRTAADTLLTIAADPKHLGARMSSGLQFLAELSSVNDHLRQSYQQLPS